MLVSPNSSVIRMAYELGITGVILPKFDKMMETTRETPHHIYSMGEHAILSMEQVRADKVLIDLLDGQNACHYNGFGIYIFGGMKDEEETFKCCSLWRNGSRITCRMWKKDRQRQSCEQ